jgi:hypothetical protein
MCLPMGVSHPIASLSAAIVPVLRAKLFRADLLIKIYTNLPSA